MSVPPPSWTPNSTSTGSCSIGVRSATALSKAITLVRNAGIDASTAPNTAAYTTLSAMLPDWSIATITSRDRLR